MLRRISLLTIVCALVCFGARQHLCYAGNEKASNQAIEMLLKGPKGDVAFAFISPAMKRPLVIDNDYASGKGAIFRETAQGRTWLRGEPKWTKREKGYFQGKWELDDGQTVSVSVFAEPERFRVKFSSEGGPEVLKWGFNIKAEKDEYFTGLIERVVDGNQKKSWAKGITTAMNLRGQSVEMLVKPSVALYAPFYLSSKGYGLFVKGSWPGHYDICKEVPDLVQIEFEGPELSFTIYTSASPAEIVKAHAIDAGPPILPPKWAFLPWRWRDEHVNRKTYYDGTPVSAPYNSEVVEDVLMMEAFDIPCGAYWVDRPWAIGPFGYSDFEWDAERFPNAEHMIRWLESKKVKFMLWIAPWVMGDMAKTAKERGYAAPTEEKGRKLGRVLIDFTNPDAVKWWQEEGLAKVLSQGVRGFKLDRSEEIVPESRDVRVHDGRTMREVRNDYPVQYVRAVNEICRKMCGDDFVIFPRAAYTGSARYGGFWGGDTSNSPEGLRSAIIALLRSSVMGYPIWGSDTGGYPKHMDREVAARWLGFSCFCPIMEVGPTDNRGFWDCKEEPHYDSELIAIWRLYAKVHSRLADYSYSCAEQAHRTGMPIVRPLFLVYPEQKEAWDDWHSFLYGPDILVSAIWRKGERQHSLYLPAGQKWRDAWNPKQIYNGGQKITVSAELCKIPIFIRAGARIGLGNLQELYKQSLKLAGTRPDLKELEKNVR